MAASGCGRSASFVVAVFLLMRFLVPRPPGLAQVVAPRFSQRLPATGGLLIDITHRENRTLRLLVALLLLLLLLLLLVHVHSFVSISHIKQVFLCIVGTWPTKIV